MYYALQGALGSQLPKPDLAWLHGAAPSCTPALKPGLLLACHDISEGGVAVALGRNGDRRWYGMRGLHPRDLAVDRLLFSESAGFILAAAQEQTPGSRFVRAPGDRSRGDWKTGEHASICKWVYIDTAFSSCPTLAEWNTRTHRMTTRSNKYG